MTSAQGPLKLGAVLYEGFELLDLFGPLEMFGSLHPEIEIIMVAEKSGSVSSWQGPQTIAEYDFSTCPPLDLILVPGGFGTLQALNNSSLAKFLKTYAPSATLTMSVCTGSWLLAKAGILDGRRATSNKMYFDMAVQQSSRVEWIPKARWVADGPVFTASGVSAGIDMALGAIASLFGREKAMEIANLTEYTWSQDPENDPFHRFLNRAVRLGEIQ
jgi:transcriptional regulator GlxA family with amidase domain